MSDKRLIQVLSVAFLVLAIALRLVPHSYNMAAVGALGIFVGCYWSLRLGVLFVLVAMVASDQIGQLAGVSSMGAYDPWLMATVYGGMAVAAVLGKGISWTKAPLPLGVPAGAILAGCAFFLISNFGAWLAMGDVYPRSMAGLMECYVAAIPFARNTFIGNLGYAIAFFGIYAGLSGYVGSTQTDASTVRIPSDS